MGVGWRGFGWIDGLGLLGLGFLDMREEGRWLVCLSFCALWTFGLQGREGLVSCLSLFGALLDIGLLDT